MYPSRQSQSFRHTPDADPFASFLEDLSDQVTGLKGNEKAAYDDLEFFSRYVMGYQNPEFATNSKFIRRIYRDLQYNDDDLLILGPRGSAKSTAVSVTWVLWDLGRNPLLRFLLSFASQEAQGLAFMRQLKTVIEKNERYIKIFGELKPPKPERWSDSEIIVKRPEPPSGIKDPSILVVGLGTAVPSKRADRVVCDDLVTQENAYSDIQRKKVIQFVFQTLFPILVPGGRKVMVGSRWDPQDLYNYTSLQWGLKVPDAAPIDLSALRDRYIDEIMAENVISDNELPDLIEELPELASEVVAPGG